MRQFMQIIENALEVSEEPAPHDGVTFSVDGGEITVGSYPFAPRKYTVVSFNVDEGKRNQGIGQMLLARAVERFPDLGAQVDGAASLRAFYKLGFRNPELRAAPFADYEAQRQADSSIFMALNDREGNPYA